MNTKSIASIFVLLAIVSIAVTMPSAYAEHADVAEVEMTVGSGMPGCEETLDCYSPSEVTIAAGGHVEWINNDMSDTGMGMYHTVTSGTSPFFGGDGVDGTFDSAMMAAGDSFTFEFTDAGEYSYYCTMHPWMAGLVTVEEDDHHAEEEEAAAEAAEAEAAAAEAAAAEAEAAEHEAMMAEQMTLSADGIGISVPESADAGEKVAIDVTINGEHVNYDIVATHNGEEILNVSGNHSHDGTGSHTTSALTEPASDDNPIDVTVTFQGFGMPGDDKTGPIGLTSTAQVVPEFGAIAALILVVAIASIIAITAKSKVSLMPKL